MGRSDPLNYKLTWCCLISLFWDPVLNTTCNVHNISNQMVYGTAIFKKFKLVPIFAPTPNLRGQFSAFSFIKKETSARE